MTNTNIIKILDDIHFQGAPNLQIRYSPDMVAGVPGDWWIQLIDYNLPSEFNTGRKWRMSVYMCKSEVVGTAFAAYMAWVEHEAREAFRYRGEHVFGPHFDVDVLMAIAGNKDCHEYRS